MTNSSVIFVFQQITDISSADWKRICKRYAHHNASTILNIICSECKIPAKKKKEVKAELEKELAVASGF